MHEDTPEWMGLQRPYKYAKEGTVVREHRSWHEVREQGYALRTLAAGPVVYAVRYGDGTIKIGFSVDFAQRFITHRHYGGAIILAFRPGSIEDEKAIHARLRAHRRRGKEWYHPTPEVIAAVNELRDHFNLPHLIAETSDSELTAS